LRANFPALDQVLATHEVHIVAGRTSLGFNDLALPHDGKEIVISLATRHSKKGLFQTIVGAALMWFAPGVGGALSTILFTAGAMMLSYGMSRMFQPRLPNIEQDTATGKESDIFTGGQNLPPMGAAVPLTLGRAWQGDVVVSVGVTVARG